MLLHGIRARVHMSLEKKNKVKSNSWTVESNRRVSNLLALDLSLNERLTGSNNILGPVISMRFFYYLVFGDWG